MAKTGAEKRAAAERTAEREACKAAERRRDYFADLFRVHFLVHYRNPAGEARVLECRDEVSAAFEVSYLERHGVRGVRVEDVRDRAGQKA